MNTNTGKAAQSSADESKLQGSLIASRISRQWLYIDTNIYWAINIALCMLDTIRIRFPFRFPDQSFRRFLFYSGNEMENRYMFHSYHRIWPTDLGAVIKVMYFPRLWDGLSYIMFEFSVSKLVQGVNFSKVPWGTDILAKIKEELAKIFSDLGTEPLDIKQGIFSRLDIAENYFLGDGVQGQIDRIAKKVYPRRKRVVTSNPKPNDIDNGEDNGITFKTEDKRFTFYGKFAQCHMPESKGILRGELSLRCTTDIADIFGFNGARLWPSTTNIQHPDPTGPLVA